LPDWFSDLVTEVCGQVIASKDTQDKLTLTDRVTPGSLTAAIVVTVEDLRIQFSSAVRAVESVESVESAKLQAIDALLGRRSWELSRAIARLMEQDARSVTNRTLCLPGSSRL
jgi:hypothetical protein